MLVTVAIVAALVVALTIYYFIAQSVERTKTDKDPTKRAYSDTTLQFYGISNGCISLKDGGAAIVIGTTGYDYESADDLQLLAFNNALADTFRSISATGAGSEANTGVGIQIFGQLGLLDLSDFVDRIERAEENTLEPGLAARARLDVRYMYEQAKIKPFSQTSNYCVITLSGAAVKREMLAASEQLQADKRWQSQNPATAKLASSLDFAGAADSGSPVLAGLGSSSNVRGQLGVIRGWKDDEDDYDRDQEEGDDQGEFEGDYDRDQEDLDLDRLIKGYSTTAAGGLKIEEVTDNTGADNEEELLDDGDLSIWQKMGRNVRDTWLDFKGAITASRVQLGGSIAAHATAPEVASLLFARGQIFIDMLRDFGMKGHFLDHHQYCEMINRSLYLSKRPPAYYEAAILHEVKCLKAIVRLVRSNPGLSNTQLDQLIQLKLEELGNQERTQRAEERSATPQGAGTAGSGGGDGGSNRFAQSQAPVDASYFGTAPIYFEADYVRIGLAPNLEKAQARLQIAIEDFRALPRKPYPALRYLEEILNTSGHLQSWPRVSYLTTLYISQWPPNLTMGVFNGLMSQTGLELSVSVGIKTWTKKKAQKSLNRARSRLVGSSVVDKDIKTIQERSYQLGAIDNFTAQIAADQGVFNLVSVFLTIRGNTPLDLREARNRVGGILSAYGIEVAECTYNQALGLFSALPIGRNHIADTLLIGKRVMRNMPATLTACLWPALIRDKASGSGKGSPQVLLGSDDNGALVLTEDEGLVNLHEVICGMSGSGKTVSELIELIRRLYTFPNVWVRFIDPQNLAAQIIGEVDGEIANMGGNGNVRFNFLWRFSLGGRPQVLIDQIEIFKSMLILMQERSLADIETTILKSQILKLYQHFEQGKPIISELMRSLYYRFGQELGFHNDPTGERYYLFESVITQLYAEVAERQNLPVNGYVVQVKRDPANGRAVQYQYEVPITDPTQSDYFNRSEAGVVLRVLNCTPTTTGIKRNFYAGGGYTEIEIPVAEYLDIEGALEEQGGGRIEQEAWFAFLLTHYLADPTAPRRATGTAEWVWWDNTQGQLVYSLVAPRLMFLDSEDGSEGGESFKLVDNDETGEEEEEIVELGGFLNSKQTVINASKLQFATTTNTKSSMGNTNNASPTNNPSTNPASKPARIAKHILEALPGATLRYESGPIWHRDDKWYTALASDFIGSLRATGLLNHLREDDEARALIERDLMVQLHYGEPILSDIIPLLFAKADEGGRLMGLNLESYCNTEIQGTLFNGYTNVDSSSRFLAFNVKDLQGSMLSLRMMTCVELTWREIAGTPRSAGRQYVVVWDEFGTIAKQAPEIARYVGLTYKRARALGGKIVVLEQNYETFLTEAGRHVMENAGIIKLMLQNRKEAANYWTRAENLSVEDRNRLLQAKQGEVMLIRKEEGRTTKTWARYGAHQITLDMLSTRQVDRIRYRRRKQQAANLSRTQGMVADLLPSQND